MKFFGTFEGDNFEDYAKAIDEWAASCKQLADRTLSINNNDGNLKIQPGNPDGSIKMNLSDKLCEDKKDSISKKFKKTGTYISEGMLDAMAVAEVYKQYKEKNDQDMKSCEDIKTVVPTPNDTDEISRILHMSMDDVVDILDDMASEMDVECSSSMIDELKEKLPYLVALRKSIRMIKSLKHSTDDCKKPCR